jgi:hypothetical protein
MRDKLIAAGVRNLKEFGYPNANAKNILTDMIYSSLFKAMLEDNLGMGADDAIIALLAEIAGQAGKETP